MRTHKVTTLKRKATEVLAEATRSRSPILVTQHGVPAAYLIDVASFQALRNRLRLLEGIARGEAAIQEGRTSTDVQARRKLKRWLK